MNMKKHFWIAGVLTGLLGACSPASQKDKSEGQINVLPAFENLTELKVSHLGKNIRYVPLETTDSSLVTGMQVRLLNDKIVIGSGGRSDRHCFLFDRESGKFIREIAQYGQGPKDFTFSLPTIHPVTDHLYFRRIPGKLLEYNQEGKFLGEISMRELQSRSFTPFFGETEMFVYEGNTAAKPEINGCLYQCDAATGKMDTIALFLQKVNFQDKKIKSMEAYSGIDKYGLFGYHGNFMLEYQDGTKIFYPSKFHVLWSLGKEVHFREVFSDTVFCVKDGALEPDLVFDLGERHFPIEKHGEVEGTKEYLVVTYVMEASDKVYFQCVKDMYGEFQFFNGLYWREDGKVLMGKGDFTDDLTNFIPFRPIVHTDKGEFVGILKVENIQEWLEEHPETKLEGALAPLKDLAFDANPVVVIVEP